MDLNLFQLASVAIWWQTAIGRPVTDLGTAAGIVTAVLLGLWTLTALRAVGAWRLAPANTGFGRHAQE